MTPNDRLNDMLSRYGEVCTRAQAARILGRSPKTVRAMLEDGRLETACAGEMVDVRSIAAYIQQPRQIDELTRQRKLGRKWSV
jgi:hypothetical protein